MGTARGTSRLERVLVGIAEFLVEIGVAHRLVVEIVLDFVFGIVLTGRAEGPELDLAVPAIDRGAELPPSSGIPHIVGNRERAAQFANALKTHA